MLLLQLMINKLHYFNRWLHLYRLPPQDLKLAWMASAVPSLVVTLSQRHRWDCWNNWVLHCVRIAEWFTTATELWFVAARCTYQWWTLPLWAKNRGIFYSQCPLIAISFDLWHEDMDHTKATLTAARGQSGGTGVWDAIGAGQRRYKAMRPDLRRNCCGWTSRRPYRKAGSSTVRQEE